jgi:hypothetical protein
MKSPRLNADTTHGNSRDKDTKAKDPFDRLNMILSQLLIICIVRKVQRDTVSVVQDLITAVLKEIENIRQQTSYAIHERDLMHFVL